MEQQISHCIDWVDRLRRTKDDVQGIHPLPEATYTEVRTTVLGNIFFLHFLQRLNKREPEQLLLGHIQGKFWPHSLQFALENFDNILDEY